MCFKKTTVFVNIPLIYYGLFDGNEAQQIIAANPEYLVSNSPAGPWKGDADIQKFMSAGLTNRIWTIEDIVNLAVK